MDLEKLQLNINEKITAEVGKLFSHLRELTDLKLTKEKELIEVGYRFLEITKELATVKEEMYTAERVISSERNELDNDKQALLKLKGDVKEEHSRLTKDIKNINEQTASRKEELKDVNEEIRKITPLRTVKESLENEIERLKEYHIKQQGEHDKLRTEHSDGIRDMDMEIRERGNELKAINKEISGRSRIVLPRVADLEERENKVSDKEEGLRIVEARYKKLYQDKGVNFKI